MFVNKIDCAIVPLRSGSKGLPGKNVKLFAGKPLYQYSVQQGIEFSKRCIVSTDIQDVIDGNTTNNYEIIKRPEYLAQDSTNMDQVLTHLFLETGLSSGLAILLQATTPLRTNSDISNALKHYFDGNFDLVMSVVKTDSYPLKFGFYNDGLFLPISDPNFCFSNRQSLPPLYKPNGAIYVFDIGWFMRNKGFVSNKIGAIEMDKDNSIDIDKMEDFDAAEKIYKSKS